MAADEKTSDTLASLILGGRKRAPRRVIQADLFAEVAPVEEMPVPQPVERKKTASTLPVGVPLAAPFEEPVVPERRVWTVRSLVGSIRQMVERQHVSVWVEGEISNCRPAPSGHIYFTLKDGEAQLPVVLFRRQAQLLGMKPKDGVAVEVRGRISVYESRGQLQLIAETMELRGAGALEAAFQRLKAKLLAEGLFASERKRPLPVFPRCVGVVSSPTGAVIRDIVHVVRRRHARLNLLLYPAAMQGARCAAEVAAGIRWFNAHPEHADVIVLARGGGSIEDLAGFNDEGLARAIAASAIPVVSGVGHETDVTIADFVADLRAPTPSAAAEMITAGQHRIEERVLALERRVRRAVEFRAMQARQRYQRLAAEQVLVRLRDAVNRREQRVEELRMRLEVAAARRMRQRAQRFAELGARLLRQEPTVRVAAARRRLERAADALVRLQSTVIAGRSVRVERAASRLQALSPVAVLSRGYALVYTEAGTLLRDVSEIEAGAVIRARLDTGSLRATVMSTTEKDRDRIMKKLFGTDGIRAVAGEYPLDAPTIYAVGLALAHHLGSSPRVLLGQDTRESSDWIAATLTAGLTAGGAAVESAGVITTPAVAFLAAAHGFGAGVVISASHNPWEDNGIKLFGPDGYKLPDATEVAIEEEIFRRLADAHVMETAAKAPEVNEADRAEYVRFLLAAAPGLSLDGKKIVIDCANGAASAVAPQLFQGLGGEVVITHASPNGRNINERCGALHAGVVAAEVVKHKADLGITFDGDADRALFADEHGRVVNGDAVLLLAARDLQARGLLAGDTVVATTMSNMGLEAALKRDGIKMLRAPVGDKYVLEQMRSTGAALGGEQSGHIIFTGRSTTGDGLLTALLLLDIVHRSGRSLAELTADLKTFPQVIVNVKVKEKRPLESIASVAEAIAEAERVLANSGRVVIRYSGTEALARVMIEAESEELMRHHAEAIAEAIRTEIGV